MLESKKLFEELWDKELEQITKEFNELKEEFNLESDCAFIPKAPGEVDMNPDLLEEIQRLADTDPEKFIKVYNKIGELSQAQEVRKEAAAAMLRSSDSN